MQLLLSLSRDVMKGVSEGNSKYAEKIATSFSNSYYFAPDFAMYEALIDCSRLFDSDLCHHLEPTSSMGFLSSKLIVGSASC
jgi:hypothetical protein